jgi:hypothetical protein
MANLHKVKNSPYWRIRFEHKEKLYRESSRERTKRKAEQLLARRLAEIKEEVSLDERFEWILREIDSMQQDRRDEKRQEYAERLLRNLDAKLAISNAWKAWLASPKKQTPGPSTLKAYAARWKRFADWIAEHHPRIEFMHEVSPAIGEQYAGYLAA